MDKRTEITVRIPGAAGEAVGLDDSALLEGIKREYDSSRRQWVLTGEVERIRYAGLHIGDYGDPNDTIGREFTTPAQRQACRKAGERIAQAVREAEDPVGEAGKLPPEAAEAQREGIEAVYVAARRDGCPVPCTFGEFLTEADVAMVPMFGTDEKALEFTLPGEAYRYSITPDGDVI